jgi:hypothetical protein
MWLQEWPFTIVHIFEQIKDPTHGAHDPKSKSWMFLYASHMSQTLKDYVWI